MVIGQRDNSTFFLSLNDATGEAYSAGNDFDFHGQIDEMWIFNEALDATAISNLKQFNSLVPVSGETQEQADAFLETAATSLPDALSACLENSTVVRQSLEARLPTKSMR